MMGDLSFDGETLIRELFTVTLARADWVETYLAIAEAARDLRVRELYAAGPWRAYCGERARSLELAAENLNRHLSPEENL